MAPLVGDTLSLNTVQSVTSGGQFLTAFIQTTTNASITGPGVCLGNDGGWTGARSFCPTLWVAQRGINQLIGGVLDVHGVGDVCPVYTYGHHDGGIYAQSDEGQCAASHHILENDGWFHGVVVSSSGRGDRQPKLAFTSGNPWTTDGCILLNISKGTLAGNLNGPSSPLSLTTPSASVQTFLNALPVTGVTLPLSTAIGIGPKTGIPNQSTSRDQPKLVTMTVQLAQINGVYRAFTGGFVTVAGINRVEQSIITSATKPDANGFQTVTFAVANPNAQFILFQGGLAGQYLSFDANTMRSAYYALGSLDGHNLIYARMVGGGVYLRLLPQDGSERAQTTGPASGFHLYPGAEVVRNNDQRFACTLEASPVNWQPGDLVECPHWGNGGGSTLLLRRVQHSPSDSGFGMTGICLLLEGEGIAGGNTAGLRVINTNGFSTPSPYRGSGGPLGAPAGLVFNGVWSTYFAMDYAPDAGPMFLVQSTVHDVNPIFALNYSGGGNMTFTASKRLWAVDGSFSAYALSAYTTVSANGGASLLGGRLLLQGSNDYAEIAYTGLFDPRTQRIRLHDGGNPFLQTMDFEGLSGGGFNFSLPDGGAMTPVVSVDASGLRTPGAVDAAGFKAGGKTGWSGTYKDLDGRTVTVLGGIIISVE